MRKRLIGRLRDSVGDRKPCRKEMKTESRTEKEVYASSVGTENGLGKMMTSINRGTIGGGPQ